MKSILIAAALASLLAAPAHAAETYTLLPSHTYPSFETDHWGGMSVWRGKFTKSSGSVVLDRQARTGTLEVTVETASVDVGHAAMNAVLKSARILDAEKYPTAVYRGSSMRFDGERPVEVIGELTLNGVTQPLNLQIDSFKCMQSPLYKREVCGVNAFASFNRADFGVTVNLDMGFKPEIKLAIQAEALLKVD
jgi:polyisoprenoid-binding protein YceI